MKSPFGNTLAVLVCGAFFIPTLGFAQERVVGRIYVVTADGDVRRTEDGRLVPVATGESFSASRAALEIPDQGRASLVFSNNTGVYLAADSRLDIERFDHAPFVADPNRMDDEPAISTFSGRLFSGRLAMCFPKQVFGSSVDLQIPQAVLHLRGSRIAVDVNDTRAIAFAVDGAITVSRGPEDKAGLVVETGQMVTITPGAGPQFPLLSVAPIPNDKVGELNEMMASACLSRHTVFFARPADPRRVVTPPPQEPNPTVSLDRLP
jgi:hypothetical protein